MSIFVFLIFEVETGITSACVLSSGILILLVVVVHTLVKALHSAKHHHSKHLGTLFKNDHGGCSSRTPVSRPCELKIGVDKPQMHRSQSHLQHPIPYPHCGNLRQREQYSPGGSQGHASHKETYGRDGSYPRMHRTLSTESGLLQVQAKPWNGVNNEMKSVLAQKSGVSAKDATLVWHEGIRILGQRHRLEEWWWTVIDIEPSSLSTFTLSICILTHWRQCGTKDKEDHKFVLNFLSESFV